MKYLVDQSSVLSESSFNDIIINNSPNIESDTIEDNNQKYSQHSLLSKDGMIDQQMQNLKPQKRRKKIIDTFKIGQSIGSPYCPKQCTFHYSILGNILNIKILIT